MAYTKEQAWELLTQYNKGEFHLKHANTVADVMRWYAEKLGYGDEADFWEIEDTRDRNPDELRRRYLVRRSHFMTIVSAWIVTLPISAVLSAIVFLALNALFT